MLRCLVLSLFIVFLIGCGDAINQKLMDRIEAKVVLPEGASALSEYSRSYAMDENGKVVAVYLLPFTPSSSDKRCSVMGDGFEMRACTDKEISDFNALDAEIAARDGIAGSSRWLDNVEKLPGYSDGGCGVINVIYDPAIGRVDRVWCNGSA